MELYRIVTRDVSLKGRTTRKKILGESYKADQLSDAKGSRSLASRTDLYRGGTVVV